MNILPIDNAITILGACKRILYVEKQTRCIVQKHERNSDDFGDVGSEHVRFAANLSGEMEIAPKVVQ